jgi:hypothetical protein
MNISNLAAKAVVVEITFKQGDKTVEGVVKLSDNSIEISIAGRDVTLELFEGNMNLEIFNTGAPDPYIINVWPAEVKT